MEEHEILAELGEIMDVLAELPSDAIAERLPLLDRQGELRRMLAEAQEIAGRDSSIWAEQAALKTKDQDKPYIEIHLPDSSASGA